MPPRPGCKRSFLTLLGPLTLERAYDLIGRSDRYRCSTAILARLLEGVNVADIGVLPALVWLVVRLEWTRSENAT